MTELEDEKVRKDDILSNRDKSKRLPGHSLDKKGVQIDEYKDIPTNRRPAPDDEVKPDAANAEKPETDSPASADAPKKIDRPGFDLGGSTGKTDAGKGLGLGPDATEGRKDSGLTR